MRPNLDAVSATTFLHNMPKRHQNITSDMGNTIKGAGTQQVLDGQCSRLSGVGAVLTRMGALSLEVLVVCKVSGQKKGLLSCLLHHLLCHLHAEHDQRARAAATSASPLQIAAALTPCWLHLEVPINPQTIRALWRLHSVMLHKPQP